MKIWTEKSLNDFDFWSGARDTVKYLTSDEIDTIESILEDAYPDGMNETDINDFFWFEDDTIADWLGYSSFDEIMHRDESVDECKKQKCKGKKMVEELTEDQLDFVNKFRSAIKSSPARSYWDKGVKEYALMLLDDLEEAIDDENKLPENTSELTKMLLNGAQDYQHPKDTYRHWKVFSYGGSSLIYDGDIAKALCSPSELKKTENGTKKPNKQEDWLDVQARALYQANLLLNKIFASIR